MNGLLYIIGSGFVLYLLFKFARKIFYKILMIFLAVALAIFALYYFKLGPFQKNVTHISVLKEKYCTGKSPEICDCIVKPLAHDIEKRFTKAEIDSLKSDRINSAYVFQKSLSEIKGEAKFCLKSKGKEELWSQFIKETLHIDNALTDKIESLFDDGKQALEEKVETVKDSKEGIDGRYE